MDINGERDPVVHQKAPYTIRLWCNPNNLIQATNENERWTMNKQTKRWSWKKLNWTEMRQQSKCLPNSGLERDRLKSLHMQMRFQPCNRFAMDGENQTRQQSAPTSTPCSMGSFWLPAFFHCIWLFFLFKSSVYYEYLHCTLAFFFFVELRFQPVSQPTIRLICQTFNLNWNHIIFTIK